MPGNVLALSFSSCTIVVQVFLWCPQRESEISLSQRGRELPIHNDRRGMGRREEVVENGEEERWDCRDSLFDGRNAREEERAMEWKGKT